MKKIQQLKYICSNTRFDVILAPYTTFKIGGKAWALCEVMSLRELKELLIYLTQEQIPYFVLGNGSNILVSDSGFKGVAIKLRGEFEKLDSKNGILTAGAGVNISYLLRYCMENGLGGLEFLAGIPGTVGGAVFMNAGAFGGEVLDKVEKLMIVNPFGEVILKEKKELEFSYRKMHIDNGAVVVNVWFSMKPCNKEEIKKRISFYIQLKKKSQPINCLSAGCIFKNPKEDYAGALIEKAGLKGKRIGDAEVSKLHANFIINKGNSSASDVMSLIKIIRDKVKHENGIELEPEIQFIGFD